MTKSERADQVQLGRESAEASAAFAEGMAQVKAETGPPKLSEEAIELFKAFEAELRAMRQRIFELELKCSPFTEMQERWFNAEMERRLGMQLKPQATFRGDKCSTASPLEVMRFKYNIGA